MRKEIFKWFTDNVNLTDKGVIDCGSGVQSLEVLLRSNASEIWAISIDKEEVAKNTKFSKENNSNSKVIHKVSDLTKHSSDISENYFDIAFCGYFIAGIEGHTPFRTIYFLENLQKYIKKDGIVFIDGYNYPYTTENFNELQAEIKKFMDWKDALDLLNLRIPYREVPSFYIKEIIKNYGFTIVDEIEKESIYTKDHIDGFFKPYAESIKRKSKRLFSKDLSDQICKSVDLFYSNACEKLEKNQSAVFGSNYGLIFKKN